MYKRCNSRDTLFLLDMDGVLCDFNGGAHKFHNKPYVYEKTCWSFWSETPQWHMEDEDFWKDLGYDFWSNLEWTDNGKQIVELVESVTSNIGILSSPCNTLGCRDGKQAWINRELKCYSRDVFLGKNKSKLAKAGVLVDDYDLNVDLWRMGGGKAILVPRPWNSAWGKCNWECFEKLVKEAAGG